MMCILYTQSKRNKINIFTAEANKNRIAFTYEWVIKKKTPFDDYHRGVVIWLKDYGHRNNQYEYFTYSWQSCYIWDDSITHEIDEDTHHTHTHTQFL